MHINTVNAASVAPTGWRNGGGRTRELLAWPSRSDWTLRVSVADIETDGAFSIFAGVDRRFAVIDGAGVILRVEGEPAVTLTAGDEIHSFSGDANTTCDLIDGPVRDVNVMTRRDRARLAVRSVAALPRLTGCASLAGLFTAGVCELTVGDRRLSLEPATLVWFENSQCERYELHAPSAGPQAWWLEMRML